MAIVTRNTLVYPSAHAEDDVQAVREGGVPATHPHQRKERSSD